MDIKKMLATRQKICAQTRKNRRSVKNTIPELEVKDKNRETEKFLSWKEEVQDEEKEGGKEKNEENEKEQVRARRQNADRNLLIKMFKPRQKE